jgi:hypothetical protein
MEADVVGVRGARGRHDREWTAIRHGDGPGSVRLGERRVRSTAPVSGAGGRFRAVLA